MKVPRLSEISVRNAAILAAALLILPSVLRESRVAARPAPVESADRCPHASGVASVPPGKALIGEDGHDRPGEPIDVPAFRIDRTEVTNRQFAAFVKATGYVTIAEREGAGAVFRAPVELPRGLDDASQWWSMVRGADWRHPTGPTSTIDGREDNPVVQLTLADVEQYAAWAGGRLPTGVEWERAARGEQTSPRAPLSWAYDDGKSPVANTWQGVFPLRDTGEDKHRGLAPVGCYRANPFGLYDMIGNVWEWTSASHGDGAGVVRGGSYLCAENYCANFRPAAWQAQEEGLATSHIGFRLVYPVR